MTDNATASTDNATASFNLTPGQLWLLVEAHYSRAPRAPTRSESLEHLEMAGELIRCAHDLGWKKPK